MFGVDGKKEVTHKVPKRLLKAPKRGAAAQRLETKRTKKLHKRTAKEEKARQKELERERLIAQGLDFPTKPSGVLEEGSLPPLTKDKKKKKKKSKKKGKRAKSTTRGAPRVAGLASRRAKSSGKAMDNTRADGGTYKVDVFQHLVVEAMNNISDAVEAGAPQLALRFAHQLRRRLSRGDAVALNLPDRIQTDSAQSDTQ
ncbi:hypothetical protein KIPB_007182 [Kipferlia bialata]|uniref:Uncharacterized protein n=1 Tax=Kipferlia bialata TaxID=797122 RepID=A0A9K3CZM9_9EUKA|nr:hypothetical protein KIPB_007182 [Kipferlia bialata]|eukprot:g7182.t1